MSVVNKDIPNKTKLLGQYMTPSDVADWCLDKSVFPHSFIVEPSCGCGVFLDKLRGRNPSATILGMELDKELASQYTGKEEVSIQNFYDFNGPLKQDIHFLGNPPYRSPAYSLATHKKRILVLRKKYGLSGLREEAALFLTHTIDLVLESKVNARIDYILPKAIFQNNSRSFVAFANMLKEYCSLLSVWDLDNEFPNVTRDLVYVSLDVPCKDIFFLNGVQENVDAFYRIEEPDFIPFQDIFVKTYLGSVPCESIFLSVGGEPCTHLQDRLIRLFSEEVNKNNLIDRLSYCGQPHLMALKKKNERKVEVILKYIEEVKTLQGFELSHFQDISNYKPIKHRDEDRWYFRHDFLKRASFVYQINPNPCPSFYFPGNPSNSSVDYFGYCLYDVNRNSGPGAHRTIPVGGIENNLTPSFKNYWDREAGVSYKYVLSYMEQVGKSDWFKNMKKKYQRFYFCIPKEFSRKFLDQAKVKCQD